MKAIILPLLISYIICANYLPKSGKIRVKENSGYFYLNTSEFEADSTLEIHLIAKNGRMVSNLLYVFTDISPNLYSSAPPNALSPTSTVRSRTTSKKVTAKYDDHYFYSLKNDNRYPYLIIQYMGFSGDYLEIGFTEKISPQLIILICSVVGLVLLIPIGCCICRICINRRKSTFITPQPVSPNPYTGGYPQQQQLQDIGPIISN